MRKTRCTNPLIAEDPDVTSAVKAIVEETDPARILEVCYWSREPGLLEIMRAVAMMSEEARASLEVFLAMAHDPRAIAARWDGAGRLSLTSSQVGEALAVIRLCAEHDEREKPLLPN